MIPQAPQACTTPTPPTDAPGRVVARQPVCWACLGIKPLGLFPCPLCWGTRRPWPLRWRLLQLIGALSLLPGLVWLGCAVLRWR